jgi:hypothetical protein
MVSGGSFGKNFGHGKIPVLRRHFGASTAGQPQMNEMHADEEDGDRDGFDEWDRMEMEGVLGVRSAGSEGWWYAEATRFGVGIFL